MIEAKFKQLPECKLQQLQIQFIKLVVGSCRFNSYVLEIKEIARPKRERGKIAKI